MGPLFASHIGYITPSDPLPIVLWTLLCFQRGALKHNSDGLSRGATMTALHERLLALAERLERLADRISGDVPPPVFSPSSDQTFALLRAAELRIQAEEARAIAAELEPRETAQAYEPLPVDSYPHGGF